MPRDAQASVDGESLVSGNADNKTYVLTRDDSHVWHICSDASRDVIYDGGHRE